SDLPQPRPNVIAQHRKHHMNLVSVFLKAVKLCLQASRPMAILGPSVAPRRLRLQQLSSNLGVRRFIGALLDFPQGAIQTNRRGIAALQTGYFLGRMRLSAISARRLPCGAVSFFAISSSAGIASLASGPIWPKTRAAEVRTWISLAFKASMSAGTAAL